MPFWKQQTDVREQKSKEKQKQRHGGESACPLCYFMDEKASYGPLELLPLIYYSL